MAHTKIHIPYLITDEEHANILAQLSSLSGVTVEAVPSSRTLRITQDTDPMNPRTEWDNIGVMYCKHRLYNLGDKDADDPFEEVEFKVIRGIKVTRDQYEGAEDLPDEVKHAFAEDDELQGLERDSVEFIDAFDELLSVAWRLADTEVEYVLKPDIALCIPLYLYDHSGITISHGSFSCSWDSGQVGWHYVTKEAVEREWNGDLEAARKCLEGELKDYDNYLRGNVWCFDIKDEEGNLVDSCCGFIGDELEESGLLDYIPKELHDQAEEAWDRRYED